jgi:hypothetical protein
MCSGDEDRVRRADWAGTRADSGHEVGMATTNHPLSRVVGMDDLALELSRLLRSGLPLSDRTAGLVLPNLRNVVARSIHPDDPISRIDSLNTLLTRLLTDFEHERFGQPARILFGAAAGMGGTNLTQRRRKAAVHLGYDLDHLRKRVEPEIVRAVADLLYRDMLRYKKRITASDRTSAYPVWALTDEDYTVDEELTCLVWKYAYAVRAELIGARRQDTEPGYETRVAQHLDLAEKNAILLRRAIVNYRRLFGSVILHGGLEYRVEALASLTHHSLDSTESRKGALHDI